MSDNDTAAVLQPPEPRGPRLGPHRVPRIKCGRCGASHHYDAAQGKHIGHCRECYGFLRRPTEAEHQRFSDFLVWNSRHIDAGREVR